MTEHEDAREPVVVLGGTGRVGAAVVDELTRRGRQAVVVSRGRPPSRGPLVEHRTGDVHDLAPALAGTRPRAVVLAVTPFTAPPADLDGFDGDFYVRVVDQLASLLPLGARVVHVGVTAIARLDDGGAVADHEDLFPASLRPFSDAHARGAEALREAPLDGTVLIPAAGLGMQDATSDAHPVLLPEPLTIADATAPVDHAVLARAVVDQLDVAGSDQRWLVRAPGLPLQVSN